MLKIGNLLIEKYPLLLAPMEDVTDPSFRQLCKLFGVDLMYTEFISSEALIRNVGKSLLKLRIDDSERPVGIQIYGENIDSMVEAAKIAETANPELIDINFGCPVKKIAGRGAGAGMLCNIPKMIEMTEKIVKAVRLPVTVKTRLGWDDNSKHIVEIAERLQDTGIQAIAIHGRTRAQMYTGKADWSLIGEVKNNPRMKIPVIGNGDINSGSMAKEYFERYNVDAIMVGRASIGRPYIFKEIKHFLEHGTEMTPLLLEEKVKMAKTHFEKSIQWKGFPRGLFEMRKHFSNYFKALPDFKEIRIKLVTSMDQNEIFDTLDFIQEKYKV